MRDYSELLDRIQEMIAPEDISKEAISKFIKANTRHPGRFTLVEEFLTAYSNAVSQEFAKSRKIELSPGRLGKIYDNWGRYHKKAIVIFEMGKIKAWKYLSKKKL